MMRLVYFSCYCIAILCASNKLYAQNAADKILSIPNKMIEQAQRTINNVENGLTKQSEKYLHRWQRREAKMKRKLQRTNPELAARLFNTSLDSLQSSINQLGVPMQAMPTSASDYVANIDSLGTILAFMQQNPELKNGNPQTVETALSQLQQLKGRIQNANNIQQYLRERKAILMQQLGNLPGFGKQLKKLNQQAYYYTQVVQEWKAALSQPKLLQQKAIQLLQKWPAFNQFMAKNSELARLFPGMGNNGSGSAASLIAGLQTRTQVGNLIQSQLSTGGPNPAGAQANAQQILQAQVATAMAQLDKIKNNQFSNNGSAADMPNFQANPMRHKRLISRLEPGFNIQLNKNNRYFPITADMGVQLRYILGKNAGIGLGAAYKAGLGTGWRNIRLTHNGLGLRSFADWRLKGNFWLNAGAELNYNTGFLNVTDLKQYDNWRSSALAGISKKFNVGKKKKGNAMLLYDFFHNRYRPISQPITYRITYSF